MILIADSGSTKTDWRLIDNEGKVSQARSSGINPYYQDSESIKHAISEGIQGFLNKDISSLYYYGAGCSSIENITTIESIFIDFFPKASIVVNHDLLAAAHALCAHDKGIACILGTGSNSCLYDGKKIIDNVPSLGYILGDEGSGNYLGRRLLIDFARNEMPVNIKTKLIERFDLSVADILSNTYQENMPAKYFASFSKFIFQNLKDPYLYNLVYDSISIFFDNHILRYQDADKIPVHFTGSVAFYYANILRKVASDKGIFVQRILESPIAGLTLYCKNG